MNSSMPNASHARRWRPLLGRRLLALLLALMPIEGAAATIVANGVSVAHGACTDHVCSCVKKAAPSAPAGHRKCHGDDAPAEPTSLLKGFGCNHGDGDGVVSPALTRPHLLPFAVEVDPGFQSADLVGRRPAPPLAGFPHLDRKPPRPRT
jgi:hypothetical protein